MFGRLSATHRASPADAGCLLVNLLSADHSRADAAGKHHLLMEAYVYRWYRVDGSAEAKRYLGAGRVVRVEKVE